MIPARYETILFQFIISAMMSCLVSGTVTFINLGTSGFAVMLWLKAWIIAWSIAFPAIVALSPLAKKLVRRLIAI